MNKQWILGHLREAQQELADMIARLESDPQYGEIEFEVAIAHHYHHVNTAWNSRNADDQTTATCSEDEFYAWRSFPTDIDVGR